MRAACASLLYQSELIGIVPYIYGINSKAVNTPLQTSSFPQTTPTNSMLPITSSTRLAAPLAFSINLGQLYIPHNELFCRSEDTHVLYVWRTTKGERHGGCVFAIPVDIFGAGCVTSSILDTESDTGLRSCRMTATTRMSHNGGIPPFHS